MKTKVSLFFIGIIVLAVGFVLGTLTGPKMNDTPSEVNTENELPHQNGIKHAGHDNEREEVVHLNDAQIKQAGIVIERAGPKLIGRTTRLNGEIKFNEDRTAHVVPQLAGVVASVSADMGQQVKKGQLLAVIASTQLSELRSELLATQKRRALAQITYHREKKLWEEKISSEQDYLQAQQNLSEMNIALQNATQKLSALGASANGNKSPSGLLNRYELRAPFDGMIVAKHIAQGEVVKEDANLFTISDLSTVWAEIIVPAQDLDVVRMGETAVVRATSINSIAEGKITFVGSLLGEQTRTATARVTLKNPQMAWRPGLFVNVDLTNNERVVAVAVMSDAIQTIENRSAVFVRVSDGFIPTFVVTGRTDGKYSEILEGLEKGTAYAAAGSFVIKAEQGKDSASHEH